MIAVFFQKVLAYFLYSAMESMQVGCFEHTFCLITMLPNDVHDSKIKPQRMPIGSFRVPKVAESSKANAEEYEDIVPMDEKYAALDE